MTLQDRLDRVETRLQLLRDLAAGIVQPGDAGEEVDRLARSVEQVATDCLDDLDALTLLPHKTLHQEVPEAKS